MNPTSASALVALDYLLENGPEPEVSFGIWDCDRVVLVDLALRDPVLGSASAIVALYADGRTIAPTRGGWLSLPAVDSPESQALLPGLVALARSAWWKHPLRRPEFRGCWPREIEAYSGWRMLRVEGTCGCLWEGREDLRLAHAWKAGVSYGKVFPCERHG